MHDEVRVEREEPWCDTKNMPLDEFVALFGDPDPWAVLPATWNRRINRGTGVPQGWGVLVHPELRPMMREPGSSIAGAMRRIDERVAAHRAQLRSVSGGRAAETNPPQPQRVPLDSLAGRMAEVVRLSRLKRRMRARDLARAAGLSESVLSRIERRARPLALNELDRVADALGISPAVLVESARASGSSTPEGAFASTP